MKKLLVLIAAITLCAGCSSGGDNEPGQDYTSFVFENAIRSGATLTTCVVGYERDGTWHKIAELGDIAAGSTSREVRVDDETITSVWFFSNYPSTATRLNDGFRLIKNKKNIFILQSQSGTTVSPDDPTQYPQ